jgi:endo-1,4-beta-xylanase
MQPRFGIVCIVAALISVNLYAQEPPLVRLWDKGPPGFEKNKIIPEVRDRVSKTTGEYRLTNVHHPYVTVFLLPKEKATGAAVVVVPGGGHRELWPKHEGENMAQWLSERGVAAVVLRYRLAREKDSPYTLEKVALEDGQRAMRLVRHHAKEWNIDPQRVGMMGFSAGGEVVAWVCRNPSKGDEKAEDPIERQSAIPNFQALVYSGPLGIIKQTITKENACPTFIVVGDDDGAANWLVQHYQDLRKAKVSAELHIYAKTPHAFGFRPNKPSGKPVDSWGERFYEFLGAQGFLKK